VPKIYLQTRALTRSLDFLTLCSVISYPLAIVNAFVALGLVYLYFHREEYNFHPPVRATLPIAIFFFLSNIYLIVAPFVPPSEGQNVYEHLPYYLHCVVGWGIMFAGAGYWVIWAVIMPKIGKYELVRETVIDEIDGWEGHVFKRVPLRQRKAGSSPREDGFEI
jgi:hypothetical protein